ncbi:MAG: 2-oxo acid dehydrogenase subunit E2 [Clostridiales Family XIII bacterium]|jgi:pyruvate dehydrogenase E2 component (dihydrolipoamide acetyltransferase)|nr:2-oxo acid dehydrogenase subunit E2 [Clostridiales Family XIII bacterium]
MSDKIKITPRARRIAKERGLDAEALHIAGSGFQGGVCARDLPAWPPPPPAPAPPSEARARSGKAWATPLARKIAAVEGVALDGLSGSGLSGKVSKADVLGLAGRIGLPGAVLSAAELPAAAGAVAGPGSGKRIKSAAPYTGIRKIIGDRLAESKFTAPHLYFTQKADLEKLLELRKAVNAKLEVGGAKKTSVTDFIAKAVVMSLLAYPEMNASLIGDRIEQYENVNLGIAVASKTGLIVPVIKGAERLGVAGISAAAAPLIEKARDGKLLPSEYSDGTFTISNLGMFGIENFTAILNPPEAGILAVSATKDEAVVVRTGSGEKRIEIRPMMNITLSVDHRLIDGLLAAQFVTEVKRLLESPIELII